MKLQPAWTIEPHIAACSNASSPSTLPFQELVASRDSRCGIWMICVGSWSLLPPLVRQLIDNLVGNAIKYTAPGMVPART